MNEEALRRTLETGRTWFWSRSRQEYWCKGETSGDRQWVREARYDCDVDALLFVVEQEGRGACHTGERSCFFRAFGERRHARPRLTARTSTARPAVARRVRRARARAHRRAGVARGARRPRDAGLGVREARRATETTAGFLLESVEHAERWGRFSFLGRDPALTLVVRGRSVEYRRRSARRVCPPTRARSPRSRRCSRAYRAPRIAELPPFHGGVVGYLGYDVVREIERLPDVPDRRPRACPTRCCRSPGTSPRSTTSASGST